MHPSNKAATAAWRVRPLEEPAGLWLDELERSVQAAAAFSQGKPSSSPSGFGSEQGQSNEVSFGELQLRALGKMLHSFHLLDNLELRVWNDQNELELHAQATGALAVFMDAFDCPEDVDVRVWDGSREFDMKGLEWFRRHADFQNSTIMSVISGDTCLRIRGLASVPYLLTRSDTQMELVDDGGELYVSDLKPALAGALDCVHIVDTPSSEDNERTQEAERFLSPSANDLPLPGFASRHPR